MEKRPAPKKTITLKKRIKGLGVTSYKGTVYLYFRTLKDLPSQFQVAKSSDGFSFTLIKKKPKDLISWRQVKNTLRLEKRKHEFLTPRANFFDSGKIETEAVFNTENGNLLIYHSKPDNLYFAGVALFDHNDPTILLWRCQEPLWVQPKEWIGKKCEVIIDEKDPLTPYRLALTKAFLTVMINGLWVLGIKVPTKM